MDDSNLPKGPRVSIAMPPDALSDLEAAMSVDRQQGELRSVGESWTRAVVGREFYPLRVPPGAMVRVRKLGDGLRAREPFVPGGLL